MQLDEISYFPLEQLLSELIQYIASFLAIEDLINFANANKNLLRLLQDELKKNLKIYFPIDYEEFINKKITNPLLALIRANKAFKRAVTSEQTRDIFFLARSGKLETYAAKYKIKNIDNYEDLTSFSLDDLLAIDNHNKDSIYYAIKRDDMRLLDIFYEKTKDRDFSDAYKKLDNQGNTILHWEAILRLTDGIEEGIEDNYLEAYITLKNNNNITPLSLAAKYGHTEVVKLINEHSSNIQDKSFLLQPLQFAIENKHSAIINEILKNNKEQLLSLAISDNTIDAIKLLIENGANFDTALFQAVLANNKPVIKLLIKTFKLKKLASEIISEYYFSANKTETQKLFLTLFSQIDIFPGAIDENLKYTLIQNICETDLSNEQVIDAITKTLTNTKNNQDGTYQTLMATLAPDQFQKIKELPPELFAYLNLSYETVTTNDIEKILKTYFPYEFNQLISARNHGENMDVRELLIKAYQEFSTTVKTRHTRALFYLCHDGNIDRYIENGYNNHEIATKSLLNNIFKIDNHNVPLFYAAKNKFQDLLNFFYIKAEEIYHQKANKELPYDDIPLNELQTTLICLAVMCNQIEKVKELIDNNPSLIEKPYGLAEDNLLIRTAVYGHIEIDKLLIEKQKTIGKKSFFEFINAENKNGNSAFYCACMKGHVEMVNFLIQNNANVNDPNPINGVTPLMIATAAGHIEIVKILLNIDAKLISACNKYNMNALHYAFLYNQIEAIKILFPAFQNISDVLSLFITQDKELNALGKKILVYAIQHHKVKVIQAFIEAGIEYNLRASLRICVIQQSDVNLIKIFVDGADHITPTEIKYLILMAAASNSAEAVEYFMQLSDQLWPVYVLSSTEVEQIHSASPPPSLSSQNHIRRREDEDDEDNNDQPNSKIPKVGSP